VSTYTFKASYDQGYDPCTEYVVSDVTLEEDQVTDVQAKIVSRDLSAGIKQYVLLLAGTGGAFPDPWPAAGTAPAIAASKKAKPKKVAAKKVAAKKVAPKKIAPKKPAPKKAAPKKKTPPKK